MAGKTIKLFLTDGKPNDLISAEIGQWTGKALVCTRSDLPKLAKRPEAKKPGVYILTGQDPESDTQLAYIGESENIFDRQKTHDKKIDYWDRICLFTSSDDSLTKGHIRYLEARMIEVAKEAKRTPLSNKTAPTSDEIPLPEADIADMEIFLQQMQVLLPVLGINLLKPQPTATEKKNTPESPLFVFSARGAKATAKIIDNEFVVLKDSLAAKITTDSFRPSRVKAREELIKNHVLVEQDDEHYCFSQNYAFPSVSLAASIVAGGSRNGRKEWKVQDSNQSYGEWDERRINNVLESSSSRKSGG